ncbi:DUF262 domain-containing protein [Pantoea ananatis]|uniref:DUF262 domain-containing protein n=1 Tax=Pantoea ananas TaxID=553 RepID=UPI001FF0CE5B|nr:DUF262 domain-containing protein [Pantoea ananatis]
MMEQLDKQVISIRKLLTIEQLVIPDYQRPYRWSNKNIADLFADLGAHRDKSAYRLGSVVFHQRSEEKESWLDIVDGQQRTLTLMLAVKALFETRLDSLKRKDLADQLINLRPLVNAFMARQHFVNIDSQINLRRNYLQLLRLVERTEFSEELIDFMLNRCEVVTFVLHEVSEAFQFFDSQNARGKDLAPHDLLKAFHLREFSIEESRLKAEAVAHWERLSSDHLATLFADYLFRVRQWAEGKSARIFSKNEVDLFKGINISQIEHFPYVGTLRIAHHFVDDYNSQYQRKIDNHQLSFPFHLDQMIINGRRFFEMAEHYQKQIAVIINMGHRIDQAHPGTLMNEVLEARSSKIIYTLNSYTRRTRTGDRYVRTMFDCALIFYIDKFGTKGLSLAIEKCFIWAYSCRISQQVVQLATVDNYVLNNNLLRAIRDARHPKDMHSFPLRSLSSQENKNNRNGTEDELIALFREMRFYE